MKQVVVGVFGSFDRKSLSTVGDIDLVCLRPIPLKRLGTLSRRIGKPLDVFIGPVREEDWNDKYRILPNGRYRLVSTFCGRDFFWGLRQVELEDLERLVG